MDASRQFDLAVVGGGMPGLTAAARAAGMADEVTIVRYDRGRRIDAAALTEGADR